MIIKRNIITALLILVSQLLAAQPELAEKAFREKDFNKVISLCNEILESSPGNLEIMELKALAFQEMQQYQEALTIYEQINTEGKRSVNYHKAECQELLGDTKSAYSIYEDLYRADPSDIHSLRNLGRIALKNKQYKTAENFYSVLVDSFPDNYLYRKNLGTCLYNNKNEIGALKHFERAWQINKKDLSLTTSIANVHAMMQAPHLALDILEEGYTRDSLYIPVLKTTAFINYRLEDYDDAIFFFKKALEAGDSTVFTHKYLGISLLNTNHFNESVPHLRIFFGDDTLNSEASYYLGLALTTMHNKKEGVDLLKYTIELMNPDSVFIGSVYASIGSAWSDINSCAASVEAYQKAMAYDPAEPEYIFRAARMYDQLGRTEKSVVDYKLALKSYREFLEKQTNKYQKLAEERGLDTDQIMIPFANLARQGIAAIEKELFFLGELEK